MRSQGTYKVIFYASGDDVVLVDESGTRVNRKLELWRHIRIERVQT